MKLTDERLCEVFSREMRETRDLKAAVRAVRREVEAEGELFYPHLVSSTAPNVGRVTVSSEVLVERVCAAADISREQILGRRRLPEFTRARFVLWASLSRAGHRICLITALGGWNHASVIYGIHRVEESPELTAMVERVLRAAVSETERRVA